MEFEFDPAKSASNLEKHGIDFGAVRAIWQDVMRVEIPARTAPIRATSVKRAYESDPVTARAAGLG